MRIIPDTKKVLPGFLFSFLSTKYGHALLTEGTYGAGTQHIEPNHITNLPVPQFPKTVQQKTHDLILKASKLRVDANRLLSNARKKLKVNANLKDLTSEDYEYFGNYTSGRKTSCFSRNIKEISSLTINAFNYSQKVEALETRVKTKNQYIRLHDALDAEKFFSTGSFPRIELNTPKAIQLINQQDVFDQRIQGKLIAKRNVNTSKLIEYGEVLIAGVGTLGENETFCRVIYANEELEGQLVSGEFIRMKTTEKIPSGYLFTWLSTDYGFRFIRKTQTGTKLCRPIQKLLYEMPVPVLNKEIMDEIDSDVKTAHTKRYEALKMENQAFEIIEREIESWQK